MLKRRAVCGLLVLAAALGASLPAKAQVLEDKLQQAGALLESRQVLLPAVFRFGDRRGPAVAAGSRSDINGAIRVNLATVRAHEGQELFIYGLPVPFDSAQQPVRQLVGRLLIQGDGADAAPVATVQLDAAMLPLGSVNDYHVFQEDFGDNLISADQTPEEVEVAADSLAGGFSVPSLVADASINAVVRSTATAQLVAVCSFLCTGFPVGACDCYWSKVERQMVCGKPRSIVTGSCVGWCPG